MVSRTGRQTAATHQAGGLRGAGTGWQEGCTTLQLEAVPWMSAGQGCPCGNSHRAPSPGMSACHTPLAADLQADILKEQSNPGSSSATTTKSRQAASSELLRQQGIGRVPLCDTCLKREDCHLPTITECQLGCQAGNHSEGLPFSHSTALYLPLLTPGLCCGCCLPWAPSSQPLMLRASCLCSKPSIPAQEQSQGTEPAKGTQLQPRLPPPPSLIQALLCTRKSHSYFLGRAK